MDWKKRLLMKFGLTEPFNIEFRITGKDSGQWNIQAYDRNGDTLGKMLAVRTPDEAWKVWLFLNGYSNEAIESIQVTSPDDVEGDITQELVA